MSIRQDVPAGEQPSGFRRAQKRPGRASMGDRGAAPGPVPGMGEIERGGRQGSGMVRRIRGRASDAAESGKNALAERIDSLGEGIEGRARTLERQGGIPGTAGRGLHRVGDVLEDSADYLRTHEIPEIRDDMRTRIQRHPLLSMGIAMGAGYLMGRILGAGPAGPARRFLGRAARPLGRVALGGLTTLAVRELRARRT
ncbi:MAG: hypothetical protein HY561_01070 [Gemmatimonadetes bacterium]|nr:hypothetical protein [Gemmatimonadota bacterium]